MKVSGIAAIKFALHPRSSKIFNHGKRKRELEEENVEECSRKKKKYCGYLKPTTFEVPLPRSTSKPAVSDIKCKIILNSDVSMIYSPQVSTMHESCKSPENVVTSVMSDEEIVEIGIMRLFYLGFALHKLTGKFLIVKN